ncbi:unnamed protein product [Wuchereria bancrofti]|uniref:Uncharacterized protein n=1 Tax=Wuchereria bancrofti TaxID=6293 RepID=A0A3P7ETR0_WUCBA|nr:unnamed protein product [Wuchereria bancrofti]
MRAIFDKGNVQEALKFCLERSVIPPPQLRKFLKLGDMRIEDIYNVLRQKFRIQHDFCYPILDLSRSSQKKAILLFRRIKGSDKRRNFKSLPVDQKESRTMRQNPEGTNHDYSMPAFFVSLEQWQSIGHMFQTHLIGRISKETFYGKKSSLENTAQ